MKKTAVAIMASLMVAMTVNASLNDPNVADDPNGPLVENQRLPQNRLTLQNGVVGTVTSVVLNHGRWMVTGGCTIQDTVDPLTNGFFLYSYSAFSTDPNHINYAKGLVSVDARPYGTWWFGLPPVPRSFGIQQDGTRVYLIVFSYGQVAPALAQSFGSISALKVAN